MACRCPRAGKPIDGRRTSCVDVLARFTGHLAGLWLGRPPTFAPSLAMDELGEFPVPSNAPAGASRIVNDAGQHDRDDRFCRTTDLSQPTRRSFAVRGTAKLLRFDRPPASSPADDVRGPDFGLVGGHRNVRPGEASRQIRLVNGRSTPGGTRPRANVRRHRRCLAEKSEVVMLEFPKKNDKDLSLDDSLAGFFQAREDRRTWEMN